VSAYTESETLRQLRRQLAEHTAAGPGAYDSRWQEALDDVVSRILNREDFSYDPERDPLFQQYQDRYMDLGQRAMLDTLGQAAKLTGGYGNSHAQLAGQQAYNTQLQGLYDQLPELYHLAMETYQLQGDGLRDRYDLLSGLEGTDYSRYRDGVDRWEGERGYLTGRLDKERDFDYGAYRDGVADDHWQQQFDEKQRQFNFKNGLGEFAVKPVSGRGGSGGGIGSSGGKDSMTKQEKRRPLTRGKLNIKPEEEEEK